MNRRGGEHMSNQTASVPAAIDADFVLYCQDDSMINARICDGDMVFIRQQLEVENGEIAAVLTAERSVILRRIYRDGGAVILRADNPAYPPVTLCGETAKAEIIIGKAVAICGAVK